MMMVMVHKVFFVGFQPGSKVARSGAGFQCWFRRRHKVSVVCAIELERTACCSVVHGRRMHALFRNSVFRGY